MTESPCRGAPFTRHQPGQIRGVGLDPSPMGGHDQDPGISMDVFPGPILSFRLVSRQLQEALISIRHSQGRRLRLSNHQRPMGPLRQSRCSLRA